MDLLRHWRRRTFGAAAGALIVPVAIVAAALAVGVGGGGLGSLRSIGQAVDGPQLTESDATAPGRATAGRAGRLLQRAARRARPGAGPSAQPVGQATTTAGGGGGGGVVPTATGDQTDTTTTIDDPGGNGNGPGPAKTPRPVVTVTGPAQTSVPPPVATSSPSVIRQVGDGVKGITNQVPVAGQPTGQVVDLLVQTVEGLSPKP